jgi:hypothetical protein
MDMTMRVFESLLLLFYFDLTMRLRSFGTVCSAVKMRGIASLPARKTARIDEVCRAVDVACAFYFRRVHCLQRSAATAIFLRRHGFDARMVIGAQIIPFKAHAWVEVDGRVVNDKPYMSDIYSVLERC